MAVSYGFEYPISEDLKRAVIEVLEQRKHHGGSYTQQAEERIATMFGSRYGVAANSGSAACLMILQALEVGPGDEVLVPGTSYIAPPEVVMLCGATPVFVECDPKTLIMDPAAAEKAITDRTRGIIVIHQYGHPAELDAFVDLTGKHGIWLVENCCHALGALYHDRPVGSYGLAGFVALSQKHLSVCGTGGIAFTDDEELARKMKMIACHGRTDYNQQPSYVLGYNFRFNEIQACITCHQLDSVGGWIDQRRAHAQSYTNFFREHQVPVEYPDPPDHAYHSFLHYVIQTDRRDELKAYLDQRGIANGVHYPIPGHLQPVFQDKLGHRRGLLPVSERACERILSLPASPDKRPEDIEEAASGVAEFFRR